MGYETSPPPHKVIQRRQRHSLDYLMHQMISDHLAQAGVQLLAVLMQHHGISIAIQLFKAQSTVVLLLDFLDGIFQQGPDVVHILLIHGHL